MSFHRFFFFFGLALLLAATRANAAIGDQAAPNERLIILANASDPESVKLAHYYAQRRAVPEENIVALPMPTDETITWRVLIDSIYQPLQDELVRRKWISGIAFSATDDIGRKKYSISGHTISYLLVCRGVPLRVTHDQSLYTDFPPFTNGAQFKTNQGAVDSELSLIALSNYPINAFFPNPLFMKEHPAQRDLLRIVKVTRIDGPTYADAAAMVDHALQAEKNGLIGRAYVDMGGPFPQGDTWLDETAKIIKDLDYDLMVDRQGTVLDQNARFDAPAIYFGWYAGEMSGPFYQPNFHFPPGAIALHIHSFSAQTVRSTTSNWCGPLIGKGVTATVGNVWEPYLQFTHHPDALMQALARGENLADASYYALTALSWQEVVLGDPLYRPFAQPFSEQWIARDRLPPELYPYVITREMRRLELGGQVDQAIQVGQDSQKKKPSVVVGLVLADLLKRKGGGAEAVKALHDAIKLSKLKAEDVTIFNEAAMFLSENGDPQYAAKVFQRLADLPTITMDMRNLIWKNAGKNEERLKGGGAKAAAHSE